MNVLAIPAFFFGLFGVDDQAFTLISIDQKSYSVLLADNPFEQMWDLMGRASLEADQGMLFVYEEDRKVSFWMKDVTFPLDMIFLDQCGQVSQIHETAQPDDDTVIPSNGPVRAVLELQGGASKRDQIRIGDQLRLNEAVFESC